ncbi:MAG: hypothetical protein ACFBSC_14415 [Microcoleaceae cyanobacterium]
MESGIWGDQEVCDVIAEILRKNYFFNSEQQIRESRILSQRISNKISNLEQRYKITPTLVASAITMILTEYIETRGVELISNCSHLSVKVVRELKYLGVFSYHKSRASIKSVIASIIGEEMNLRSHVTDEIAEKMLDAVDELQATGKFSSSILSGVLSQLLNQELDQPPIKCAECAAVIVRSLKNIKRLNRKILRSTSD